MKPTYEKEIEKKLGEEVKALGCKYLKIQIRSYPDRLILTKCGTAIWVETKQIGKKPRRDQIRTMEMLHDLGFQVFVCENEAMIEHIVSLVRKVLEYVDKIEANR
jgi:hypothetical protein